MTVELRRLAISSDFDASRYVAGMNQKVAADRAGAQSSREVGAAVNETQIRFGNSVSALERLSRQYVDGYGTAQRFNAEILRLARATDKEAASVEHLEQVYAGLQRRFGLVAGTQELAERGYTGLAQAIGNVNARLNEQTVAAGRSAEAMQKAAAANDNRHHGGGNFNSANAAYQFQDIAVTASMGMNPVMIGLQQGTQLASVVTSMERPIQGLFTGLMSLVSPISLITIGLTAAAAAGIQYFMSGKSEAEKLDAAIEAHQKNIRDIRGSWGEAANGIVDYANKSRNVIRAENIIAGADLRVQLKKFTDDLAGNSKLFETEADRIHKSLTAMQVAMEQETDPRKLAEMSEAFSKLYDDLEGADTVILKATERFAPLKSALDAFAESARKGTPDYIALQEAIASGLQADPTNEELIKLNKEVGEAIRNGVQLQGAMEANASAFDKVARSIESAGRRMGEFNSSMSALRQIGMPSLTDRERALNEYATASGSANNREGRDDAYAAYQGALGRIDAEERRNMAQSRRVLDADLLSMRARSPDERAAAAGAREEAIVNRGESEAVRQGRIMEAETRARVEAEHQLSEAQKERTRSLQESVRQQEFELSMIGKTVGEVAALRAEYDLTARVREEAARNGMAVDERELDLIRTKAAEIGRLTELYARQTLQRDMLFEREQMFRSSQDQAIASRLRGAGLPVDLNSSDARYMRETMDIGDRQDLVRGFFTDLRDAAINSGGDIGEALGDAVKNALLNRLTKWSEAAIDNMANIIAGLFSGTGSASNAAGGLGAAAAGVTRLLPAANDNVATAGAGSALSFVGNYRGGGVDARLTDILSSAAKEFPRFKADAISGFRAGDPRFHGRGLATDIQLTDVASGRLLGNYQDASSFRTYEQFAQTARRIQMDRYPELADKFRWGGYFGGGKGKYGALDTMHFDLAGAGMAGGSWDRGLTSAQASLWPGINSQGMGDAAAALEKLSSSAGAATEGLGVLGSGFGKLGQSLSTSYFPAAPTGGGGGGGLLGWLGGLFGGFKPNGAQATLAASGSIFGMFDRGGYTGPGGVNDPAGVVHRGEVVWSQADIARAGGVAAVEGMRLGYRGYAGGGIVDGRSFVPAPLPAAFSEPSFGGGGRERGGLEINVYGGSGDEHVRGLVREGVQRSFGDYEDSQRRGGFGSMQRRFVSQKG